MAKKKKKWEPHGERIQDKPRSPVKNIPSSQDGEFGGLNLPYGEYRDHGPRIKDKVRKRKKKKSS